MKRLNTLDATPLWVEIRPHSLHAWSGDTGIDLPLERGADGRLLPASVARATTALEGLQAGKSWLTRTRVFCAIGSRGVILRPLSLPITAATEVNPLLQLQIETEFPLPPEALAWGWILAPTPADQIVGTSPVSPPNSPRQNILVAAIKKEVIEEYAALFKSLDPDPLFTLAALARLGALPNSEPPVALLDVGPGHSELTVLGVGAAPSVQILPWNELRWQERLAAASAAAAGPNEPPAVAAPTFPPPTPEPELPGAESTAIRTVWQELLGQIRAALPPDAITFPLWIAAPLPIASRLGTQLGSAGSARALSFPSGPGRTAATFGLSHLWERHRGLTDQVILTLRAKPAAPPRTTLRTLPRRQIALGAALLLAVVLLPYLEALLFQPRLARRLAALQANQSQLAMIDRELSFFRYFEQNQAPQLDAAYVIAQAAPPGAHLDNVTMNRQGNVTLTGYLRDLSQIGDFRLKLINSGFFSTVVAEDQTPTPDRQRINFRITAQWKDGDEREALVLGPALPEPGTGTSKTTNASPSGRASDGSTNVVPPSTNSISPPATNPLTGPVPATPVPSRPAR